MKRILSQFRPEEILAICFLVVLGILNLVGQRQFDWSYMELMVSFSGSFFPYFFMAAALHLLLVVVWRKKNLKLHPLRDWMPFVVCLITYELLSKFANWINPNDQDALLAAIDHTIFGVHPTVWMERFISPGLTDYLSLTYALYFFWPPLLGCDLYLRRKLGSFRDLMLAVVLTCFIGYIGYLLVPAVGPQYFQSALYTRGLDSGPTGNAIIFTVDELKPILRDCFPSLHTAVTTVVLIFAWRHSRLLFWPILPLCLSLFFSTMYLRFHYFIDLVAGWVLASIAVHLAVRLNLWWYRNIKALS
jgi:membrane-associated phospholipid phosphatase